jgi:alpha-galactosidase
VYSSVQSQHGFQPDGDLSTPREFQDWLVLEDAATSESALIGGELGMGMLAWKADVRKSATGTIVTAGNTLIKPRKSGPEPVFEVAPGEKVESPLSFFALAKGDTDNAGNEAFRYLKRYIFPTPMADAPWLTYCIWLTERNSEAPILRELQLAERLGFDVFYHDATWFEGASVVPGMNDWSKGLGSYQENKEKFPHGIKYLSDEVRAKGMKFGIWVDPSNVDEARVTSGEIPDDWLVKIDGKSIGVVHPSLTRTKEICMGDPKVVEWLKKQLGDIIEKWNLQWIKWDPSATESYECNRTDHGHGRSNGAYAAYQGRLEIMRYLMERFPNLVGFECDPSLHYSRTNPGPRNLLPGGYTNEFITGPMVSPYVWGSLATAGKGDARASYLTEGWYSASALDYYIRKNLLHGFSFGNINGMWSQLLSAAPAGYLEALQRNIHYFKQYRELLYEDVYHPQIATGWSSVQYLKPDSSEGVVYVFRDKSPQADATLRLKALDPTARYQVTSLNDRPGRERIFTGESLMKGLSVHLPEQWLAEGDGIFNDEYAHQRDYGSDVLLLHRLP